MDYFMPSDVARLVLGYLKENSYQKTFQCFLKECCHLQEFYSLVKAGRQPKQISQLNLIIILEEWGQFKFQNDNTGENVQTRASSPTSSCSYDTADDTLVSDNDVTRKSSVKRSPKRNKKITLVTKKVKSPVRKSPKSPKSPKSINISLLSPRKLRSGKSVRKDGTHSVDSPGRSSTKSSVRTQETPEKSATAQSTLVRTHSEIKQLPSDGNLNQSPSKHVQFSSTTKTSEQRNCDQNVDLVTSVKVTLQDETVCNDKNRTKKASGVELESGNVKTNGHGSSEVIHRSKQDLTSKTDKKNTNSARNVILSETLAKHDALPPSESVGIADKCISWMNGNEREESSNRDPATVESHGTSSECSSSVSNVNTGEKSKNKPDQNPLSMNHEPIIPILKTPKKTSPSIFKSSGELITPVKLLLASGEHVSRSPRRKKPKTPRKRNSEVSPVSLVSGVMSALSVDPMFEKILGDHRLHQKLAETCNSIVQSQIKGNSGREKKDTSDRVSPAPTQVSIDQETIAASKSLEEILEIDNNFHSEFLSDNFDMSDPAYESLFKLFGTDRETFSGYLRREKEKELAQMEAEVEELERSNHEILCANFGMSHADTSYDTDGLNSPHHVMNSHQDLFSSQQSTSSLPLVPGHATSTPCIESVPVNFTPLLRSHELGSSPVRSSSGIYSGVASACDKRTSPGSTTTQPFSPAFSHHSDMNPPPTPRSHPLLTKYINDPRSPRLCSAELPYSNPTTPQPPSSPHGSHLVHSTPTGSDSVRSQNYDHFYQSSPIHPTNSIVPTGKVPNPCSPLVKADLQSGSPRMVQKSAGLTQGNTLPHAMATNSNLYFSSQQKINPSNDHTDSNSLQLPDVTAPCFMNLLTDNHQQVLSTGGETCSTIDNAIGCISLPPSSGNQHDVNTEAEKSDGKSKKSKGKKQKGKTFSTLKGLLCKPLTHRNSVPLGLTAGELHEALKNSEKRGEHSLTFHSPNGKSSFKVPILDCQNDSAGMGVLGMSGTDSEADHTINVYNENLDSSREYSIAPENQATQDLVNAIKAGSSAVVLQEMQSKKSKKAKSEKKTRKKTKEKEKKNESTKNIDECEISGSTPSVAHNDLDPNQEVYTATPLTALSKATTVRALNFGTNPDDQSVGGYRKIFPKMPVSLTPSVLILNTNKLITPTQKVVVNTTPNTVNFQNLTTSHTVVSNSKVNNKTLKTGKLESPESDVAMETGEVSERVKSVSKTKEDSNTSIPTPPSDRRQTRSCSKDLQDISDNRKTKVSNCSKDTADGESVFGKANIEVKSKNERVDLGVEIDSEQVVDTENVTTVNEVLKGSVQTVEISDTNEPVTDSSFNKRSSRNKQKLNKSREKLKVKLPVHKSPRSKKHDNDDAKACIPFYFKPKNKMESSENPPSAPLNTKSSKKTKSETSKSRSKKTVKSIPIIIESESSEDESLGKKSSLPTTPVKTENHEMSDNGELINENDDSSSKELLLEKIGLTPKKNIADIEKVLRSPNRANALDVLAEWQSSPLNSRKRSVTPNTRNRYRRTDVENSPMKSPSTPKRKTPAKKLFTSPCKEQSSTETRKVAAKSKSTAKRVSGIIDRLKLNNPDTRLPSPIHAARKESQVTEAADGDFIDNKDIDDHTKNTEHKSKRSKKGSTDRKKKKKSSKKIENISDEESGKLNNEITELETNKVTNKSEGINVFDKVSGNSEGVQKEFEISNSPVKSVDIESVDNAMNEEANELDQAVASIASDHEEFGFQNSVNVEALQTRLNDNTERIERYEYSHTCSDIDEVDHGSVHLQEDNQHEVFDTDSSSHTIITKAEVHVSPTLTEDLVEGNADTNQEDDNNSDIDVDNNSETEGLDLENEVNRSNHSEDLNAENNDNDSDSDNFQIHAPSQGLDVMDNRVENLDKGINVVDSVNSSENLVVSSLQSEGVSPEMNSVSDINEKSNRKEKKKKRKHRRHRHRDRHTSNTETGGEGDVAVGDLFVTPATEGDNENKHRHHKKKKRHTSNAETGANGEVAVGDLFVTPETEGDSEHKHRHHKKKKRKSHKRQREDDEDRQHHKRHKKDKSRLSLDSLNVEEALSQIYK